MFKKYIKKYLSGAFYLNLPVVVNAVILLVTLPIILKSLPIIDYGKYQLVLAIIGVIAVFTLPQITIAAKRGIANSLKGTFLHAFIYRFKLSLLIIFFVIATGVFLYAYNYNTFSLLLLIIGFYIIIGRLFEDSFFHYLIAQKRFAAISLLKIIFFVISNIGAVIVAYYTNNIVLFASFLYGSVTILSFLTWVVIIKKAKLFNSYHNKEIDKNCIPYGKKLLLVEIIQIVASKFSHFIIGSFFGFSNLAIFSVADRLKEKFKSFTKSFKPLFYSDFSKQKRDNLIKVVNKFIIKIGVLSIGISTVVFGLGVGYIHFFIPEEFQQAIWYFAILAIGFPVFLIIPILKTIFESHLRYKELRIIIVVSNILRILFILIFGFLWQLYGVCIAIVASVWIQFVVSYYFIIRNKSIQNSLFAEKD